MNALTTTRMSSRGQVVIPESIRKQLNLVEGTQFVVVAENDVVLLKIIEAPVIIDFDDLLQQARAQAASAGLKQSDISDATKKARGH
ncbi:MAG: AbrB/MazE/SpoVT family DNA-binding domain-containing protein [Proteobacteria bacterium]|jgi:AbrB family looped-hinge helix DNA binding protein|nr:AbrB/MazE/SpoVT family DNA-binding domain-containing protein [Pseudomonadota bacterium]